MKRKSALLYLVLFPLVSFSQVQLIHETAWKEVSSRALTELDHKYGIYSSRSLSVYNPEIYLQADSIWIECFATKFNGWKNDYTYRPEFLHTEEVYWDSVFMVVNNSFLGDPIASYQKTRNLIGRFLTINSISIISLLFAHYTITMLHS